MADSTFEEEMALVWMEVETFTHAYQGFQIMGLGTRDERVALFAARADCMRSLHDRLERLMNNRLFERVASQHTRVSFRVAVVLLAGFLEEFRTMGEGEVEQDADGERG